MESTTERTACLTSYVASQVIGDIGTITIANPPINTLSVKVFEELDEAFGQMMKNDAVRTVVITGSGKFFSAGTDIGMFFGLLQQGAEAEIRARLARFHEIILRIDEAQKTIIAAVNGACFGGGLELALACDYILAVPEAMFGFQEVTLGIMPALGGTRRFPKKVGKAYAAKRILAGQKFTAQEAMRVGLLEGISADLDKAVKEFVTHRMPLAESPLSDIPEFVTIEQNGNPSFAADEAYVSIMRGSAMPLRKALENEAEHFIACLRSPEGREGIRVFVESRKPDFPLAA